MRRFTSDERGQSLVIVVISMFVVLGIAAVVIDVSTWHIRHHQAQVAADAAALATANECATLSTTNTPCSGSAGQDTAETVGEDIASDNGLKITEADFTFSGNAVHVTVPGMGSVYFASIAKVKPPAISAGADASYSTPQVCATPGGSQSCGAIFSADPTCAATNTGQTVETGVYDTGPGPEDPYIPNDPTNSSGNAYPDGSTKYDYDYWGVYQYQDEPDNNVFAPGVVWYNPGVAEGAPGTANLNALNGQIMSDGEVTIALVWSEAQGYTELEHGAGTDCNLWISGWPYTETVAYGYGDGGIPWTFCANGSAYVGGSCGNGTTDDYPPVGTLPADTSYPEDYASSTSLYQLPAGTADETAGAPDTYTAAGSTTTTTTGAGCSTTDPCTYTATTTTGTQCSTTTPCTFATSITTTTTGKGCSTSDPCTYTTTTTGTYEGTGTDPCSAGTPCTFATEIKTTTTGSGCSTGDTCTFTDDDITYTTTTGTCSTGTPCTGTPTLTSGYCENYVTGTGNKYTCTESGGVYTFTYDDVTYKGTADKCSTGDPCTPTLTSGGCTTDTCTFETPLATTTTGTYCSTSDHCTYTTTTTNTTTTGTQCTTDTCTFQTPLTTTTGSPTDSYCSSSDLCSYTGTYEGTGTNPCSTTVVCTYTDAISVNTGVWYSDGDGSAKCPATWFQSTTAPSGAYLEMTFSSAASNANITITAEGSGESSTTCKDEPIIPTGVYYTGGNITVTNTTAWEIGTSDATLIGTGTSSTVSVTGNTTNGGFNKLCPYNAGTYSATACASGSNGLLLYQADDYQSGAATPCPSGTSSQMPLTDIGTVGDSSTLNDTIFAPCSQIYFNSVYGGQTFIEGYDVDLYNVFGFTGNGPYVPPTSTNSDSLTP